MIKAILFDWAGVLAIDGYWVWLRENVPDIEEKKAFFEKISDEVDKATITNKQFVDLIAKETKIPAERIWPEIYSKIIINYELLDLLKELKKKYKVGLLSNFTFEWLNEIFTKNNIYQYFDATFISSEHKMIKPQPEAFQKALDLVRVSKDEAIFIDDRQVHIDAANSFGLKAILYTYNEKLKQDLRDLGIL